ncbi:hypothetical protein ACVBEH_19240, partial [Roseateles sp. GG27B]
MWRILKQVARTGRLTEAPPVVTLGEPATDNNDRPTAPLIHQDLLRIIGRALSIRAVDAGSCNGCELEISALNNPIYNIEGLIVGLLLGLAVALGVALYITKVPIPFINKVPQ